MKLFPAFMARLKVPEEGAIVVSSTVKLDVASTVTSALSKAATSALDEI